MLVTSGQFSNQLGIGLVSILAQQESWTEHQDQKLHKEKENPDKHYSYDTEFT